MLPASIKRIGSKTAEKRWRHHFPHYKLMGAFSCHGNQSFDPICPKTSCSLSPTPIMLHIKFDQDWPLNGLQRYSHLKVWMTDHWYTIYKLTLWAFCSGCPKTLCNLSPTPMMIHIKFDKDWPWLQRHSSSKVKFVSLKGKQLQNEWSDSAQNRTRPSFHDCPGYQQLWWWFHHKWMS